MSLCLSNCNTTNIHSRYGGFQSQDCIILPTNSHCNQQTEISIICDPVGYSILKVSSIEFNQCSHTGCNHILLTESGSTQGMVNFKSQISYIVVQIYIYLFYLFLCYIVANDICSWDKQQYGQLGIMNRQFYATEAYPLSDHTFACLNSNKTIVQIHIINDYFTFFVKRNGSAVNKIHIRLFIFIQCIFHVN